MPGIVYITTSHQRFIYFAIYELTWNQRPLQALRDQESKTRPTWSVFINFCYAMRKPIFFNYISSMLSWDIWKRHCQDFYLPCSWAFIYDVAFWKKKKREWCHRVSSFPLFFKMCTSCLAGPQIPSPSIAWTHSLQSSPKKELWYVHLLQWHKKRVARVGAAPGACLQGGIPEVASRRQWSWPWLQLWFG